MAKANNPIPPGMHTATPMLCVENASEAIELYKKAFGAIETSRAMDPSGARVWHASFSIGNSMLFIGDAFPGMAEAYAARIWLYVEDTDATFRQAVASGLKGDMPPSDMFWGDRHARVSDKYGNIFAIATHMEDLTPEEMQERQDAFVKAQQTQHSQG
jgi:PhnB protein